MPGFVVLIASCSAGYAGLGVWAPVVLGFALHLTVADTYVQTWDAFKRIAASAVLLRTWLQSVALAMVATGAAWLLGRVVALL